MHKPIKYLMVALPMLLALGCSSAPEIDPSTTMLVETKTSEIEVVLQEVTYGGFMDAKEASVVEKNALDSRQKGEILDQIEDLADDLDVEVVEDRYQYGKFAINEGSRLSFMLNRDHTPFLDQMREAGAVNLNEKGNEAFSFEVTPITLGKKATLGITVYNSAYDEFLSGKIRNQEVKHSVEAKYEYNYALFLSTAENRGVMLAYRVAEPEDKFIEIPIASGLIADAEMKVTPDENSSD